MKNVTLFGWTLQVQVNTHVERDYWFSFTHGPDLVNKRHFCDSFELTI
uniref:Uncharacterized protein n=1 Tax=Tetranychus urticae TaxID=32264 RepID=T1JXT7_TETUR